MRALARFGSGMLVGFLLGTWLPPALADTGGSPPLVAIPIPAIPGAALLPGPIADVASPGSSIKLLNVSPDRGIAGTDVTVSGSGLPANADVELTWSTANATWVVDPEPSTVDYHGRKVTPLAVVMDRGRTDASGAIRLTFKAPDDFGGLHDLYAVVGHTQVAHGGFLIQRSFSISPRSGPIGTPITITYKGVGSSLYEGGGALLYDNHYTGAITSYWTRGTARFTIRASGPVGVHTISVYDAITYPYLNIQQTTIPWARGFVATFRVTRDAGPPPASLDWPVNVAPTITQRTTLEQSNTSNAVKLHLSVANVAVKQSVAASVTGLASSAPVTFQWATVVGSRINCTSICWASISQPLGQATPSNGTATAALQAPDGLGGWHAIQALQGGTMIAQQPIFLKQSIVGSGVSAIRLKEGQAFTIHLKGVGWTQLDNTRAVTYDNSYIGYGCGFSSNGDVQFQLHATGGLGTHLIDVYPVLFTETPSFGNTPYGMAPILTYRRDFPALALGYAIPAARLAITIVK